MRINCNFGDGEKGHSLTSLLSLSSRYQLLPGWGYWSKWTISRLRSPWTRHGTYRALRAYLFCPVCIAVTLGDPDQRELLKHYVPNVGIGQIALSLFRKTKLRNWALLLFVVAKGHGSWETDEVIGSRTQIKFVAKREPCWSSWLQSSILTPSQAPLTFFPKFSLF